MNLNQLLMAMANRVKPVLIKLVPIQLLRKLKKRILLNTIKKLEKIEKQPFSTERYPRGINLVGSVKAATGLGQSSRLIEYVLSRSEIPYSIYNFMQSSVKSISDKSYDSKITKEFPYSINLLHVNTQEFPIAASSLEKEVWNQRYNIAFWLWELEEFPEEWVRCMNLLDEIWTPAEFVSESIRKKTNLPVRTIPYHVTAPVDTQYDRKHFKLPEDKFLYLTMYDSNSIMERKNPKAVFDAFKRAFDKDNQEVGLVVKVNSPAREDLEAIERSLSEYSNIYLVADNLEKIQVNSLIKCVDVFVSLHRAEGFGLVMAEAMLVGTPNIATNWSANTEFMNAEVACMVDYELIGLKEDIPPYKKGSHWADPDVNQAAKYMDKLFSDKEYYNRIANKAKDYIDEKLCLERSIQLINQRIDEIYNDVSEENAI